MSLTVTHKLRNKYLIVSGTKTSRSKICTKIHSQLKVKGKGQVLDIALLRNEHVLRSALQSWKWQLIGMS